MWGPWLDPTHQRLPHGAPFSFFIFFRSKGSTHLIPLDLFRSPAQPSSCSRQTRSGMRTPRSSSQSVSISEGGAPLLSYLVGGFVGSGRGDNGNSHPQRLGLKILPRFEPTQGPQTRFETKIRSQRAQIRAECYHFRRLNTLAGL